MTFPISETERLQRIEAVVNAVREHRRLFWRPNNRDDEIALDIVRQMAEAREAASAGRLTWWPRHSRTCKQGASAGAP